MPNKNYQKGTRKEYKICDDLKKEGFDIVQRTAGSHSRIDIIAIRIKERIIKLIQSKRTLNKEMEYIDERLKKKIEEENKELNNHVFNVYFEVR
jgi:Holliday junction resolvase